MALGGPFLLQGALAPRALQPRVEPLAAVLLGQGVLWLLTGAVLAITVAWEREPVAALAAFVPGARRWWPRRAATTSSCSSPSW